jgi:hypothetical protein
MSYIGENGPDEPYSLTRSITKAVFTIHRLFRHMCMCGLLLQGMIFVIRCGTSLFPF